MAAAAIGAIADARWTQWMRSVVVPLTWVTSLLSGGSAMARDVIAPPDAAASVPPEQFAAVTRENEELKLQIAHQSLRLAEAERTIGELSGLAEQLRGQDVRIRLATRVAGGDASPARDTMTISAGSVQDVRVGDWVLAGRRVEGPDGELTGWDLMLRNTVIGRVIAAERYRAVVRLATDRQFGPEKVWVAQRLADGSLQVVDQDALLYGMGEGKMRIREATQNHFANGSLEVLVPLGTRFASPLLIGRITGGRSVRESALHFDLDVEPLVDTRWLTHVSVVMLDR
jgi:cell shape-determining protein MreC